MYKHRQYQSAVDKGETGSVQVFIQICRHSRHNNKNKESAAQHKSIWCMYGAMEDICLANIRVLASFETAFEVSFKYA